MRGRFPRSLHCDNEVFHGLACNAKAKTLESCMKDWNPPVVVFDLY